ncbi:MAG: putative toxin-antitoxin system toxin component, PIN family [Planctomycetales bacterium]
MTIVFDSNVLIPLILEASKSTRLFSRLRNAGHQVALSPELYDEVREKLRTKQALREWLGLPDKDIEEFLQQLPVLCAVVQGVANVRGSVPADPDDEMVIAAAVDANADYIVTEDKHLLELQEYDGIRILNRDEFAAELDRLGVP